LTVRGGGSVLLFAVTGGRTPVVPSVMGPKLPLAVIALLPRNFRPLVFSHADILG